MKASETHVWSDQALIRLIEGTNAFGKPKYVAKIDRKQFESKLSTVVKFNAKLSATGSYIRGTHIQPFSDWDYFLPLPWEFSKKSVHEIFTNIAFALDAIIDKNVKIEIDWPALVVTSAVKSEVFDVVPIIKQSNCVLISDDVGYGWKEVHPKFHNKYLHSRYLMDADLRYFIRLLKAWNYCNGRPFVSIFLELFVCNHMSYNSHLSLIGGFQKIIGELICEKFWEPESEHPKSLMNVNALHGGFVGRRTVKSILEYSKDCAFRVEQLEKSGDIISMRHEVDKLLPLTDRKDVRLLSYRYMADEKVLRKIKY